MISNCEGWKVEKPIDREEIENAVAETVRLHLERSSNMAAQTIRSRMEKARLAAAMTQITEQNEDSIRRAWCALGLPAGGKLWFSTILVHLTNVSDCSEIPGLTDFMSWLQKAAQKKKIAFLYSSRTESRLLLHLYRSAELTREYVAWFTLQLQKFLMNRFQFFIAAGMPVRGLLQVGLSYPVNRTDWKVVSILPRADALEESNQAVWRFLAICVVVFLLARTISGRIASVVNEMRQTPVSRPRKITSLPPSRNEVGQLVDSYNTMTDALNDLMDRQAEDAKALRLSEFNALQAQINPHFLYNCLDMINWLAVAGEQDKVCETIQTLGKFYRLTLSKRDTFGTVRKETEHATLYVKLQNMRFQNRLRFVADIDDALQSCIMPKLVFQPLVENAILHGIMERDDKTGEMVLAGWRDGDDIVFLIYDNGVGMTAAQIETITSPEHAGTGSGAHIGVYNTNERLRLYYGPEYGLQYRSTPGQGAEVQVRIPFRPQSD